jgi:D-glycero-D-manno-heptose 1,7-bisphosphate phosphatase
MSSNVKRAAVFLDRDGTLIRDVKYLCAVEQIEILPGAAAALFLLRAHGFKLVVVTNQSGVARGRLSELDLQAIHAELMERLGRDGAVLDAIYYCPHHPTEGLGDFRRICECRKPKTGMIERAARELDLDPKLSYVVGDKWTDIELAQGAGATGIFIGRDEAKNGAVAGFDVPLVADLRQAAEWIVGHSPSVRTGAKNP